jgi:sugar/nucleoside kinase (ribokinase family)
LDRLCRAIPIVALTHGHRGSEVIERGRSRRVGIYATRASDPTGAGDAFAAAFFHEVARGQDPVEAARMGAAVASIAIEGRGAPRIARWDVAVERAARVPVDRKSW